MEYNKYYEPKMVINCLEGILKKDFNSIKTYVDSSGINVSEEQVKKFLNQKFIEEDPELKKRIEGPRKMRNKDLTKISSDEVEAASQEFVDSMCAERYKYDPYTLKYFDTYTGILKFKINKLFNIIECIGNKNVSVITDELVDLDIVLDKDYKILGSDIHRLIDPTVYNINKLGYILRKANNLNTYLTMKMSIGSFDKDGMSEYNLYPSRKIQIKNLFYSDVMGYVPLSERQMAVLREEQDKDIKNYVKSLFD